MCGEPRMSPVQGPPLAAARISHFFVISLFQWRGASTINDFRQKLACISHLASHLPY